ncbi:hypothetical protein ACJW30_10G018600 [Castanea mollissima]
MSLSKHLPIFFFLLITLLSALAHAARFNVRNNCPFTRLNSGESWPLDVNSCTKRARIWARAKCNFNGSGRFKCQTGDCGGLLHCKAYGATPNTLAEFALNQYQNLDYFDISLVDGFNVPMEFSPTSDECTKGIRCTADINKQFPAKLKVQVGCNNPCTRFKTNEYCCYSGSYGPTIYSKFFKVPDLFTCNGGTNYKVVFCP